jgi:formylglycine-generating enzyme required for sulfatase activity/predicted Ser/Thr protein kinase
VALFESHPRYTIDTEPLGSGGMGTVFRAFDNKLHRHVAIKVMNAVVIKDDDVKRFEREARSMAHMQHPHICPIHDYDRIDGHPYFVMDLIEGRSLQDIIENAWPLSNRDIAKWIWQVARALKHVHAKNVRHRDIKPANIMINAEGDAVLMDFGLAQYAEVTHSLTQSGGFMGTPAYASPEQARETKSIDHRADIYSLGIVLYVLLCRNRPYEGSGLSIVMRLREGKTFPPPSAYYSAVDADLEAICLKAAALDPGQRYQSMTEFAAALEAYMQANLITATKERTTSWLGESSQDSSAPISMSHDNSHSERTPASPSATNRRASAEFISLGPTKLIRESHETQLNDLASPTQTDPLELHDSPTRKPFSPRVSWRQVIGLTIVIAMAMLGLLFIKADISDQPSANSHTKAASALRDTGELTSNPLPLDSESPDFLLAPFDETVARERQQAWVKYLGDSDLVETNSTNMKMVLIPPGEFMMGSPPSEPDHKPDELQHRVRITRPFYLGAYEVTQPEWQQVMQTTPWRGKSYVKEGANFPATYVSWADAVAFCKKLTEQERQAGLLPEGWEYRLPTEAEWEYACRAGTITAYSFGDAESRLGDYGWYGAVQGNGNAKGEDYAHAVGQKKPNPWGLCDMHGNVWEWCADWYDAGYYAMSPVEDPKGPSAITSQVYRGASWHGGAKLCRSAARYESVPGILGYALGFRVAAVQVPDGQAGVKSEPTK